MNFDISNKLIAKITIYLYIRMFFVLAISLYTTRALLAALGVVDYGIYNVVCGFVSMFNFMNASMANGIQRFYNFELGKNNIEHVKKVYITAVYIQFLLSILIVILTETIGVWYLQNKMVIPLERYDAAEWIFHLSVLSSAIVIMQVPYSAAVMAHEKMNFYALISILDAIFKLIFVILLQYISIDKLIFYGFLMIVTNSINFILYYLYCKHNFTEIKFKFIYDLNLLRKMLSFSGWNIFGTCAYMIKGQGINVLLNSFFGPAVNAARGVSFQIQGAIQNFSSSIFTSFRPQLVKSYASNDYDRTTSLMFSMSKYTFFLLYMIAVPVIIEIEYILNLWLDANIPKYTAVFTILVIINMLISNFNAPLTLVIHATGKMKAYQIATSIIITSILPTSWLVLAYGGISDPVIVFIIDIFTVLINQIICMLIVKRVFSFSLKRYCIKVIVPSLLVFLSLPIIPFLIFSFMEMSFFRLCCVCISSILFGVIFIYLLGLDKTEKEIVTSLIKKILKIN